MKRTLTGLMLFAISVFAHGNARAETVAMERIRNSETVQVGYRAGAIPFSYLLPGRPQPVGYAIDICARVVDALRVEMKLPRLNVKFVAVDPKTRFTSLKNGDIDLECANTTVTADRRQQGFDFSIPYFITGSKILVRSDLKAEQLRDLGGRRVILAEGTTTAATVRDRETVYKVGMSFMYMKKRAEGFEWMEQGKADAMVEDLTVLLGFRANSKNPDRYRIIGNYLAVEPFAIMLRNNEPALKTVADRTMGVLMRSGELEQLHHKWFESAIAPSNASMAIPIGVLMKDMIKYPTDQANAFP